jgi:hypothetical protein
VCRAEISKLDTNPCGRRQRSRRYGPRFGRWRWVSWLICSLIHRLAAVAQLRRLPQELRQDRQLCSLLILILILILLLSARQSRHHKSRLGCRPNAGGVEWAERHGCRESAPGHGCPFGAGPRSVAGVRVFRRRSRTKPGASTLGYLVSFQVTRRRRNRSGVSQSPISRAAITWRIQISSCTRNPVGAAGAVRQPRSGGSVDNFITDPPPRPNRGPYRRDLRRLPQEMRQDRQLCSLLILILLLSARQFRRTNRDLGAGRTQAARSGPSGMDAARAPSGHGCPFGAGPRSVARVRVFRRRRNPTRSQDTWLLGVFSSNSPKAKQIWR